MLNCGTLACATLTLGLLAIPGAQPELSVLPAESVQLAWKLQKDATYLVDVTAATATNTVTGGQEQAEVQDLSSRYAVFVEDVTDEGNMLLTITVDQYGMEKESPMFDVEMTGERDENGEVVIDVQLTSDMDLLTGPDVQELFEELVRGSMGLEYQMLLTPQGHVLEASLDGDPLGDLPTDTELTKMIADTARIMVDTEDMPGIFASQLFSVLPEGRVDVGDEWELERSFVAAGLSMDGTGSCTLVELGKDNSTAKISESLTYDLGTSGLSENMVDLLDMILSGQGIEMEVSIDLEGDPVESTMEIEFDIEGGFNRSMDSSEVISSVSGAMTVGETDVDIDVETNTSSTCKWTLKEDE